MKIGVITIFSCVENSGAFLQAYALKLFLESNGHTVYHIVNEESYFKKYFRRYAENYVLCRKNLIIFRKLLKFVRVFKQTFSYKKEYDKKYFVCKSDFSKMNVIGVKKANNLGLDMIICGSDEIWNLKNPDVGTNFYFGKNIKCSHKIAYAVSAGNCSVDEFYREKYPVSAIREFECVLVRDNVTRKIVEDITSEKVDIVCDPTILLGIDKLQSYTKVVPYKYILVYSYWIDDKVRELIIRYARVNNLKIVSAIMKHGFEDYYVFVSPLNFGNWIKNAECVYTSTLHGSIFTILNHKKAVFKCGLPKVREIVESFNLSERIIEDDIDYEQFKGIIEKPVDKTDIETRRRKMSKESSRRLIELLTEVECIDKRD